MAGGKNVWPGRGALVCRESAPLKGQHAQKYRSLLDTHILPGLGAEALHQITSVRICDFLQTALAAGRRRRGWWFISGLCQYDAYDHPCGIAAGGPGAVEPPLRTRPPHIPVMPREIPVLSRQEQLRLESLLLSQLDPGKLGILLSLHTGLRIGEVCALAWEDIDLDAQIIHVRHTVARVLCSTQDSGRKTKLVLDTPKTDPQAGHSDPDMAAAAAGSDAGNLLWIVCNLCNRRLSQPQDIFLSIS